ncbi:putative Cleavage stimulation factor subunit 1 [Cardiosporidium cionae]|uniref:Cleavage stimulation factor 50 kDa subunit n=1 Tax=Cardiosporidium cionae TaxID=476202 RepID=A0ABQ7JA47_9APIC|nr:putative Cleavage stimulation factor subunit 1 [Cardiosporidium cionae]|eukprot:KAF8820877.1 putative Cleavage stimulation factor subunit 1 [Cardiosporidium cionae]
MTDEQQEAVLPHKTAFPAVKLSFYELLLRQLLDDGFYETAEALKNAIQVKPNYDIGKDYLYQIYDGAALKPLPNKSVLQSTPILQTSASETPLYGNAFASSIKNWQPLRIPSMRLNIPLEFIANYHTSERIDELPKDSTEKLLDMKPPEEAVSMKHSRSLSVLPSIHLRCELKQAAECLCVAISPDRSYMASGGNDKCVYAMDIPKLQRDLQETAMFSPYDKSLLKQKNLQIFEEHSAPVTALCFHPFKPVCCSGSMDKTVKLYNVSEENMEKPGSFSNDLYPIHSLCFHPCGDFLYVGTSHPTIRLYDFQSAVCYTSRKLELNHTNSINTIRCSADGSIVASASDDGTIKFWDAISFKCINTIENAHRCYPVKSIQWSHSGHYILSSGLDGQMRIWDIRRGQEVLVIGSGRQADISHCSASFLFDESLILYASKCAHANQDILMYNSFSGNLLSTLKSHHFNEMSALETVPGEVAFATASRDSRCCLFDIKQASLPQEDNYPSVV